VAPHQTTTGTNLSSMTVLKAKPIVNKERLERGIFILDNTVNITSPKPNKRIFLSQMSDVNPLPSSHGPWHRVVLEGAGVCILNLEVATKN
jgi:hypothetical protein